MTSHSKKSILKLIEYYLPEKTLSNEKIAAENPDWSIEKIYNKTGIKNRHIADENECASDLAFHAAKKLFEKNNIKPSDIEYVLLCTQSPDYFLPTTACILQSRLGIPETAGALDFNLGCSGYIYGLSLAKGLIESGQVKNVLLLTAETYSKYLHENDKAVRTIFGDGASASLIECASGQKNEMHIKNVVFGTDGLGAHNLIVGAGASRNEPESHLKMNGPEIFTFTLKAVPNVIQRLLKLTNLTIDKIDHFIFHQANAYMLNHLREQLHIPKEKFIVYLENVGNTVSSTIPIAYKESAIQKNSQPGEKVMLVGFGVGYSWGAVLLENI